MTTLGGRTRTALLVVDVQRGVVDGVHDRDAVVERIAALVERARVGGATVVWVQHHDAELERGSGAWQIVDELRPGPNEPVVHKSWNDAFEETDLEDVLAARSVARLVVVGAQTEWCIRATLHGAIARGYDALLVSDAHTTTGAPPLLPPAAVIDMTNAYWTWHAAPGRTAGTAASTDVRFRD